MQHLPFEIPISMPMAFMIALSVLMVWVVLSDLIHYIIPNTLNIILLVLYIAGIILLPLTGWMGALAAAAIVLLPGLGLFALGLMGGGDVKLLVMLALWTGWGMTTVEFMFMTAIFGGLLVVLVLLSRALIGPVWVKILPRRNLPRILTRKQPVPYGIAIAAAFMWMLWMGQIAGISA